VTAPPAGSYSSIAGGLWNTCAVQSDGAVVCWGRAPATQTGPFVDVAVGEAWACAIDSNGTMSCWDGVVGLDLEDNGDQIRLMADWSSGSPVTIALVDFNSFGWPAESQSNTYQLEPSAHDEASNDLAANWCSEARTPTLGEANGVDDPC
jgi:hypothetical protein